MPLCRVEALTTIRSPLTRWGWVMEETLQRGRALQRTIKSTTVEAGAAALEAKPI